MELFIWPSEFGLPSMDIYSLQFMACSKFCAAPITFRHSKQPWESPTGELPYFVNNETGEKITDFVQFVDYLRNSKQDVVLDNELIPTQLSDFDAYNALINQKLRPAMLQLLWIDRYNYTAITHECYAQHLYFPYNFIWTNRRRREAEKLVNRCNKSPQELILDAIQALNLLSSKLSDNKYFCGDKPSSLDALVFGYLAPLMRTPLPNDRLQMHLAATPNLVRFVESILSIYMPLSDQILRELKSSRPFWQKRKDEAQKLMEDTRIEREMKKNEREKQKESGLQRTIFFVFGSIVVAALFSIHTGIFTIEKPEKKKKRKGKAKGVRITEDNIFLCLAQLWSPLCSQFIRAYSPLRGRKRRKQERKKAIKNQ